MNPSPAPSPQRGEGNKSSPSGRSSPTERFIDPAPRFEHDVLALRVAREFKDGDVVNLGIGIPTLCSNFVPEGVQILYQSESGVLNFGPLAEEGEGSIDLINAGGQFITSNPGMALFDSVEAFAMIRGGHVDVTVLGALQVSQTGDLANWFLPSRGIGNVGGAMDLAVGAKRVIVAMEHTDRQGNPKIVERCTFPLTGKRCVKLVITDVAVIEVLADGAGLLLKEVAPGWDAKSVQAITGARLQPATDLQEFTFV